jgi:hypothetical protein
MLPLGQSLYRDFAENVVSWIGVSFARSFSIPRANSVKSSFAQSIPGARLMTCRCVAAERKGAALEELLTF